LQLDKTKLSSLSLIKRDFIEINRLQIDNMPRAFNASSIKTPLGRLMIFRTNEND
jgi:hypothetical protein